MTATTRFTEADSSSSGGLPRRAVAAIGEQSAISLFQFSPILAAALSGRPDGLAWTAAFTACFGLVIAAFRGAVIHPVVRTGAVEQRYPASSFVVVCASCAAALTAIGLTGAFSTEGTLIVLGVSTPIIGFVEMSRIVPAGDRDRLMTVGTAVTLAAVVTLFPLYARVEATPVRVTVVWSACWLLLMVRFAVRSERVGLTLRRPVDRAAAAGLTLNNLIGQVAAQGPILVIAAILGPGPLSALQAARVPFRPVAVLAAALPVHYLPYLVETRHRPGRWARSARMLLVVALAATAGLLAPALFLLPALPTFAATGAAVTVVSALVGTTAIAEAAMGVIAVAAGRERAAIAARLVGLAVALVVIAGLAAAGRLSPLAAAASLGVGPSVTAVLVRREVPWG
ncbi:MAG: hypothetical protein AAF547_13680 [Actinomycetota bacterium]